LPTDHGSPITNRQPPIRIAAQLFPFLSPLRLFNSAPMNVNLGIWDKLSKLVIFLLFVAVLAFVFWWYLPLIQKNQNYRKKLLALEAETVQQEKANRQLRSSIDAIQNDPKTIERMAREKLGWAKSNEMVVRFQGAPADSGQRR
jgi:cell division protein FtsB